MALELRTSLTAEVCLSAISDIGEGRSVSQVISDDPEAFFRSAAARRALYELGSAIDGRRFSSRARPVELVVQEEGRDGVVSSVALAAVVDGPAPGSPLRCTLRCAQAPASPAPSSGRAVAPALSPELLPARPAPAPKTPADVPAQLGARRASLRQQAGAKPDAPHTEHAAAGEAGREGGKRKRPSVTPVRLTKARGAA